MAQIKTAKDGLEKAVTDYYCSKSGIMKELAKTTTNTRMLTSKMSKFDTALKELNNTHTSWLSKADLPDEELATKKYSPKWLEGVWNEFYEIQDEVDEKLSVYTAQTEPPAHNNEQKLKIYSKQMETLKQDIKTKTEQLMSRTSDSMSAESHNRYEEMLSEVKDNLNVKFVELFKSLLSLDMVNMNNLLEENEQFRQTQQSNIVTIQFHLAEHVPSSSSSSSPPQPVIKGIEMEKSKAPMFTGRTIDYPEFKRGWNKTAGTVWTDENQVEQIKLKVDNESRRIMTRCKTMAEVWSVLDGEYAQEQEVVNAVDQELMMLRSAECTTSEYIVKLRSHLPNLEEALLAVDGLEHLKSPQRVHFLVEKFDDRTMYDWEYFRSKATGPTYKRFFDFILDRYDAARSSIARLKNRTHTVTLPGAVCTTCVQNGHVAQECPRNASINHTTVDSECRRCNKWVARDNVYTCPGCGRGTPKDAKINHCLEHCGAYLSMPVNERSNCVEAAKWCPVHLLGSHQLEECNMKNEPRFLCGINGCSKHHHKTLHQSTTPFITRVNATQINNPAKTGEVLLLVQSVDTTTGSTTVFYDNGSTCCLITLDAADRLNLVGEAVTISIKTINETKTLPSFAYSVTLIDIHGGSHIITAYGVANISNRRNPVDISGVIGEFSPHVQNDWDRIEQPSGEIELLIGMNACGLHPTDHEVSGNLKVMSSKFGSGLMLAGTHPEIRLQPTEWNEDVSYIRLASVGDIIVPVSQEINKIRVSVKPSHEFFEGDIMGVAPPRRCDNCRKCKECLFRSSECTQVEQYQYQVMESKVTYVESQQSFYVQYPFMEDPHILSYNLGQVIKIAEREEKKLMQEGNLPQFNSEFDKMLATNVLVELSKEDIEMWDGPEHWVSLQHVLNESSATTALRIVANSSLSDKRGVSLNSIMMKGPNTLSNQFEILSRWRSYVKAMCSDVSKAYWSLRTGETEKHVRRVVWRYGDTSQPWRTFAFCVVSFGDKPAATILEIAIKKIAETHSVIDPEVAHRIIADRYVDDIVSGGTEMQVARFVGEGTAGSYCGTMSDILSRGSLNLKVIVTSGETDLEKLQKLGGSVLGVGYDPPSDTLTINLTNTSTKQRKGNKKGKPVQPVDLNDISIFTLLTLRICLSIINCIYDPLGLVIPVTVRLKVAFRNLFRKGLDLKWDDLIPLEDREQWHDLIQMLTSAKSIVFPRATKPSNAIGKCQLVCYFDGSDSAYAAVIYVRWMLIDASVFTTLVNCKSRVMPLLRISTPRSELNGAVLASRLVLSTVRSWASADETPEQIWMIGDSECTLASIEKVNAAFGEFFGNRVGEILDNQARIEEFCSIGNSGEWWHVSSKDNGADIATRLDSSPWDLGLGSEWQTGPSYLKLPQGEWPINRDFATRKEDHIPQGELLKKFREIVNTNAIQLEPVGGIDKQIDPHSTNDWGVLLRKTQNLIRVVENLDIHKRSNIAQGVVDARILWFRTVMKDTEEAQQKGKLRELDLQDMNGMKVVFGRAKEGLRNFFGQNYLPVIMGHTRIAEMIMLAAHNLDHTGRDITQAIARHEAWIVNAKKLAKQIVKGCVRCRFIRKILEEQKISVLPDYVQIQCPPYTNIGLDLTGPIIVKAMTNKRATMKVWVAIFLCLNTKAVCMELAPGYSTADFLLAYETHTNQRGAPATVHSDRGSQLVAAKKELCEYPLNYDWEAIAASTTKDGTKWNFTPAGAQWRNGATEAFVKKFKHSFLHMYKDTKLHFAELNCAVKRIANVLNHRPLSAQRPKTDGQEVDFLSPLTPNMLTTGRSASGPPKDFVEEDDPKLRLSFLHELERAWWYQYKVQYFDSLVPTRKWTERKRNITPGDVVLIEYKSKTAPGTYRLGKVLNVEVDDDELVRTCTVMYKLVRPINDKNRDSVEDVVTKEVRVPVQRLVMILPIEEQC